MKTLFHHGKTRSLKTRSVSYYSLTSACNRNALFVALTYSVYTIHVHFFLKIFSKFLLYVPHCSMH